MNLIEKTITIQQLEKQLKTAKGLTKWRIENAIKKLKESIYD